MYSSTTQTIVAQPSRTAMLPLGANRHDLLHARREIPDDAPWETLIGCLDTSATSECRSYTVTAEPDAPKLRVDRPPPPTGDDAIAANM